MIKALRNRLDQIQERHSASFHGPGFFVNRNDEKLEALREYVGREVFYISWAGIGRPPVVKSFKVQRVYMTSSGYARIKVGDWSSCDAGEFARRFYPTELDAERDLLRRAEGAVENKHDELKKMRHRLRMIKQRQKRRGLPWT